MPERAKVNGQNVLEYLTMIPGDMPSAKTIENVEALLAWAFAPEQVNWRYAAMPAPCLPWEPT